MLSDLTAILIDFIPVMFYQRIMMIEADKDDRRAKATEFLWIVQAALLSITVAISWRF
jgi:hypothetical protein